jgi:hypothetical protein
MNDCNRRVFTMRVIAGSSLVAATGLQAQETKEVKVSSEKVTEADPYAKSMGFRLNTANADKVKFPRHDVSQKCSECQLFSGKPGEPFGPCSFYGGRQVPVDGWCRNFKVKKAKA